MKTTFQNITDKKARTELRKRANKLLQEQKYSVVRMMAGTVDIKNYGMYFKEVGDSVELILSRSLHHAEKFIFTLTTIEYSYKRGGETVTFDLTGEPWAVWLSDHIKESNVVKSRMRGMKETAIFLLILLTIAMVSLLTSCAIIPRQVHYQYEYIRLKDGSKGFATDIVQYDIGDTIEMIPSGEKFVITGVKIEGEEKMLRKK